MRKRYRTFVAWRNKKLRYDFLPPMLEIMEKPANPVGKGIIWGIILITFCTIIWAGRCKLDIAVTAQGFVMPQEELMDIKSIAGGVIENVAIEDGDYVEQGDCILSVEQQQIKLQLAEYEDNLEIMKVQREIYSLIQDEIDFANYDVEQYGSNKNVAQAIISEYELYMCNLKEYERCSTQGEAYRNAKDSFVKEHELTVLQNINTLDVNIRSVQSEIEKLQKQLDDSVIKAPAAGKITQLTCGVRGTTIESGEHICYVIPQNATMQFEAYVSDSDIKDIYIGDQVKVRLSIYKDTGAEIIGGTVTKISDVAVAMQGEGYCYKVDIELEETKGLAEHVGATGTCDIIIGSRSVLDYFMEPFKKGLEDSLK